LKPTAQLLNQLTNIFGVMNSQTEFTYNQENAAFILSFISGVLILLQGILRVIRSQWGLMLGIGELRKHSLGWIDYKVLGIITVALGVMVVLGSILLIKPGREREGGITVIAFSMLSILSGGGYYMAGLILGVVGGALALSQYQKRVNPPAAS
jgi:hypothetical protein